jgi:multicomponent Na+:H+ antiporter subunit D
MLPTTLLPITVLLPLAVACLLLASSHWLPPWTANVAAILTSILTALLCAWLAQCTLDAPVLHWFGGWTPQAGHHSDVVLGISFEANPVNAAMAAFCALIFLASFIFSWGSFDAIHSHFQILMLFFLAALVGFCLTHDLFNLFVWFELMSVAAFAVTAYPLGKSSLEGAFNFIVTNSLASFMMLAGVGLLYARTGTLDFTLMGLKVADAPADPVLAGGFTLVAVALLTKGAILPFNLWLSDAHAVAPSPVSMIFSGAMVGTALFGLARLITDVFLRNPQISALIHTALPALGIATALVGGVMAWSQRHLKRLLAFSTIAHMGVMLTAIATVSAPGMGGMLLYLVGHGVVKATLFMIAGILLTLLSSADEITLYGRGRDLWPAGVAMALAGVLLGGLPVGVLNGATEIVRQTQTPLVNIAILISTALTGAAVLRAAARIFFGCSGAPGLEFTAPTEREHEKTRRPLWLMLGPCYVLLALDLTPPSILAPYLSQSITRFFPTTSVPSPSFQPPPLSLESFAPLAFMAITVAIALARQRPTSPAARLIFQIESLPVRVLQSVHSGLVGDYVAWTIAGVALLGTVLMVS